MSVDLNLLFTESVKHFMHRAERCLHQIWRLQEDWPDWKEDVRGRAETMRPTVLAGLNPADERVVLRDAVRARLDQLLADDARLQAILAAHREYEALQDHIGRIDEEIAFFRARRLVPVLRLMRLRLLRGDLSMPLRGRQLPAVQTVIDGATRIYWKGAGVIIAESIEHPEVFERFDVLVETRNARALAWLYGQLRDEASGALSYLNKYEFYGKVGQAVNVLLRRKPQAGQPDVLLAALDGALAVLKAWEDRDVFNDIAGRFGYKGVF